MGSLTEAIAYINADADDLSMVRANMSHIQEGEGLKCARKIRLKDKRAEKKK